MNLDYSIKDIDERKQIVEQILSENEENINMYFEMVHLNKNNKIPFNYLLGTLTNYLLYCNNEPTYKQKNQYKFEKDALHLSESEYKLDCMPSSINDNDIKNIPQIKELNNFIDQLKINSCKINNRKWINDLKFTQREIKNSYSNSIGVQNKCKPPIYEQDFGMDEDIFEISDINNPLNLDLFEPENWKIVLKILSCGEKISDNVNKLIKIFNKIYPLCKLSEAECKIIAVLRDQTVKNKDLAAELDVSPSEITKTINDICEELSEEFVRFFEDKIYYTSLVRGTYKECPICGCNKIIQQFDNDRGMCRDCYGKRKQCPKCGELKFLDEFGKHPNTKDKLQSWCKSCDSNRKS